MKDYKSTIPKRYWNGSNQPRAKAVGTLIKHLESLPKNMRLTDELEVTVFNISTKPVVGVSET